MATLPGRVHLELVLRCCDIFRSHPYAFSLDGSCQCLILSGNSETESQLWMRQIRDVLWPRAPSVWLRSGNWVIFASTAHLFTRPLGQANLHEMWEGPCQRPCQITHDGRNSIIIFYAFFGRRFLVVERSLPMQMKVDAKGYQTKGERLTRFMWIMGRGPWIITSSIPTRSIKIHIIIILLSAP